jgi:DNA gyrase subunit A
VGAAAVSDDEQLMLMTSGGQSIRIRVDEVRVTGRNAQGVKLLALSGDERLQDIATVVGDESEGPSDGEESPADESTDPNEGGEQGGAELSEGPEKEGSDD